jgi:Yip1 domain
MTEVNNLEQVERPRRLHFEWILPVLFKPRSTFGKIASQPAGVWLVPLLILSITTLASVAVAGSIKHAAALSGTPNLPPDFQYMPPEMQAQYMQAMQATSSPVFLYVFPAVTSLGAVWLGWLLVTGILHLVLTLLGGRGDTGSTLNVVAWSGLPFAVRDLVRAIFMLATRQLLTSPGFSGFIPAEAAGWTAYLGQLLRLVDIYVIWNLVLLVLGVLAGTKLSKAKAVGSVIFTVLLLLALQALIGFLVTSLSSLNVIRPFF